MGSVETDTGHSSQQWKSDRTKYKQHLGTDPLCELLELRYVWMRDHGATPPASCTTTEWLLRGKQPRVCCSYYISNEVVTISKCCHPSTVVWESVDFLHFWSNCEHQRGFYFRENSAKKGKKIADIHKSWFLDMSVIINWIAVVLYVFQAQTVSKKSQLLCVQQLRGTDAAAYSPLFLLLPSHRVTVSPPLRVFFTLLPYLSQTFLWKQSSVRDHCTFLFFFF